jgi:polyphosphate kinase
MAQKRFFNRELSWLEFNQRVLDQALDPTVPLLERLNFLSITASNLDEFFMVRVGGLQILNEQGIVKPDESGMTPAQQLGAIGERVHQMTVDQYRCYCDELEVGLGAAGIRRLKAVDLSEEHKEQAQSYFDKQVFPVVTPMAVDPRLRLPLLRNLGLNIAVRIKGSPGGPANRFAIVPLGPRPNRFVRLAGEGFAYILLEDLIGLFLGRFFPGEKVVASAVFRITRNADLSVSEDQAADLLSEMKEVLDARKQSSCVRLEVENGVSPQLLSFLARVLDVDAQDVFRIPGPPDLSAFRSLVPLEGYAALRSEPWPPLPSPYIDHRISIFKELANRSILLYHPYESFDPVLRLVEEAASDPDVLAIKQILYRTSRNSPVVEALRKAAQNGKYVTAIVELKARFDEARNIEWAQELEQSGVQVIYGVRGLKTHAKLCVVVRREPQGIMRYLHFGTGNYNEITARLYSDASYFTCDPDLAGDASAFFNAITGYSQPQGLVKLEAAPVGLRARLLELIDSEIKRKEDGQKALIVLKMNSLVDPELIKALYRASKAGVTVRLNVRGICCLRPGVKRLSENVSVISIVDRFLEHSRIYYFYQGGEQKVFISSADWMPRNLDRRIELLTPIEDATSQRRLIDILNTYFEDTAKAKSLQPDGRYLPVAHAPGKKKVRSQETLYQRAAYEARQAQIAGRTVFEPLRPAH